MKTLIKNIKTWWNHPCFWYHDYEIVANEQRALAYKCQKCGKINIQTF